ncbi:RNA polymerase sigma factor [Actinomadura macrotermitis]|uniref:ECF RNA polymerase sigma factor SigW n=1 Tax=Actinomadura macrotermitis TaxID=2585200 RepID=A0A7K0BVK0_9ACTN|nr:RNA polymerase sigma factor [Actinomadura macrotermitis]MQY04922.1 ECF RNA polymerase sigma factor SigW [Actinomadura macrotermitis]
MIAPPEAPPGDAGVIGRSRDEPELFGAIFDAYFAEIHRYLARRLDAHTADDLAAETFAVAFRGRDRYDLSRPNARPWLYGIATNLAGRHRRDERRKLTALARVGPGAAAAGHEDAVAARVTAEGVRGPLARAVAALPAGQRDVLLLVVLGGLSYEEVAVALDVPFGTVSSRLNRARKKLRKALGDTDPLLDDQEGASR